MISEHKKIKNVFFNFIQKVVTPPTSITLSCSKDTYLYQATCIEFIENDELIRDTEIERARKGLADNKDNNESSIYNNVDYIIVNSIDPQDVISAGIEKITEVKSYESTSLTAEESDNFTEAKEVKFVDSRIALGEING